MVCLFFCAEIQCNLQYRAISCAVNPHACWIRANNWSNVSADANPFTSRYTFRHRKDRNGSRAADDAAVDSSVNNSDDSAEALIGVSPEHLDPALMQAGSEDLDDEVLHSSTSSVSLSLTEQYSVASCSYPPLPVPTLQQLTSGITMSPAASADLEHVSDSREGSVT